MHSSHRQNSKHKCLMSGTVWVQDACKIQANNEKPSFHKDLQGLIHRKWGCVILSICCCNTKFIPLLTPIYLFSCFSPSYRHFGHFVFQSEFGGRGHAHCSWKAVTGFVSIFFSSLPCNTTFTLFRSFSPKQKSTSGYVCLPTPWMKTQHNSLG